MKKKKLLTAVDENLEMFFYQVGDITTRPVKDKFFASTAHGIGPQCIVVEEKNR